MCTFIRYQTKNSKHHVKKKKKRKTSLNLTEKSDLFVHWSKTLNLEIKTNDECCYLFSIVLNPDIFEKDNYNLFVSGVLKRINVSRWFV